MLILIILYNSTHPINKQRCQLGHPRGPLLLKWFNILVKKQFGKPVNNYHSDWTELCSNQRVFATSKNADFMISINRFA